MSWVWLCRARLVRAAIALAALASLALLGPRPAGAAGGPVNVTLNIPADIRPNPCMPGDVVNVSGTLRITYYVRNDGSAGFHVNMSTVEQARGQSLTTAVRYLLSETHEESWQARAGSTHTSVLTSLLVSQSATDNLVMRTRFHTTITAAGIPTAGFDRFDLECEG